MTLKIRQPVLAHSGLKVGKDAAEVVSTNPVGLANATAVTNIVRMADQAAYDALPAYDDATLYVVPD